MILKPLLGNILLALAWVVITGHFTLTNFALGLLVGFAMLWIAGGLVGARHYTRQVRATFRLAGTFLWELTLSTLRVTYDVVTPRIRATPAIVGIDLEARGDIELLLIFMLLTLTPGTVVVHIPQDRQRMYIYGMYVEDAEAFQQRIRRTFEQRVLAVTRSSER